MLQDEKIAEYSHFTVTAAISIPGLKKKPHLISQKQLRSVSRAAVNCSYLLQHDILHASLPRTQHTNTLEVITTRILRRVTLGLPKYSETQKLNTYQSWEKKI